MDEEEEKGADLQVKPPRGKPANERPPLLLRPADWPPRAGRGCWESKDVRARLKICGSQILRLAHDPSCFVYMLTTGVPQDPY